MKIKDIMNKDISAIETFKYNPENWAVDAVKLLTGQKNVYKRLPVVDLRGHFMGVIDICRLKDSLKNKTPPKFTALPVLLPEHDLGQCKNRKIDDKYLDENQHVFVVDESGILVGFIPAEVLRLLINMEYLYTFIEAINNVHDGIVLVDKNSKILYVNDAYSKILNVDKYKVLNKFVKEIEPEALILKVLETNEPIVNTPVKVKSVGKDIVVNISPIIIRGALEGAISIFKDVTEVSILTRELENMRRITGYFYKGAAKFQNTLPQSFSNIVGKDNRFLRCLKLAAIVAPTDATVLVEGESGVGKEVVVEAIYRASKRASKPFMRINCSAIPDNLFESELFGYEAGSFTGAQRGGKAGKFELADGGTIFLDEIGEMPLLMQAKLLRVLQSGELQKIGSNTVQHVDVRVIAATNRNLMAMVKDGSFREDLYFRLNTFTITIPPLRVRKGDIPLLAHYFLNLYCSKYEKKLDFSPEVLEHLTSYYWPGNVRELQSCIEYAVILCQDDTIGMEHLPEEIQNAAGFCGLERNIRREKQDLKNMISEIERNKIIDSLKETSGNRTKAMGKLGMSRRTFYRKLKIYNINPDAYTR